MGPENFSEKEQDNQWIENVDVPENKELFDVEGNPAYQELGSSSDSNEEVADGETTNSSDIAKKTEAQEWEPYIIKISPKQASGFITKLYSEKGERNTTPEFDAEQTQILTDEGIMDKDGEIDPKKLNDFKTTLLHNKGLLDTEWNLNTTEMKDFFERQKLLKLYYKSPEQAETLNYIFWKDPQKDAKELINGYQSLLTELWCFHKGRIDQTQFNNIKKQIQEWNKKNDQEFNEIVNTNMDENQILTFKKHQVIESLAKFEKVQAGENLFNILNESFQNDEIFQQDPETLKLFRDNEELFKTIFQNQVFFEQHLPKLLAHTMANLKKEEKDFLFNLFNQNEASRKFIKKFTGTNRKKQQKEFLAIILHPEDYSDQPEEAQARKTLVSFFVSKLINQKFINTYTQKVYAQQILKEQVNTYEIFETAMQTVSTIVSSANNVKGFFNIWRQHQKKSETSNYFSLSHEKGTYKDGTFVSGHQTWAEIVDEYFDTDKKFAEGIKDLSNENFQNDIKKVLDKRFNNPEYLKNKATDIIKHNFTLNITEGGHEKITSVDIGFNDIFNESQISSFLRGDYISDQQVKDNIGKKLWEVWIPHENISSLTNDIFPQIKDSITNFHEMQKKQKDKPQEFAENFEVKINKQVIGYVVSQMKDCLKSNDITARISLEKNKENKSGEMEGLEIRNHKLYLKGSLDNSPCTLCYDLGTGALNINSCCTQENDAFYFNNAEPNLKLATLQSFKKLQKRALNILSQTENPHNIEEDIFNTKEEDPPKLEAKALSSLELNASKNEFYNVFLDAIQYQDDVISSIKAPWQNLYYFIESFEQIKDNESFQAMTNFINEIKNIANLPQGLNEDALKQTDSQILKTLFKQDKILEDKEFSKLNNNSIALLLSHFIQTTDLNVKFNTHDANLWITKLTKEKWWEGKDSITAIEDQLFYQKRKENKSKENNSQENNSNDTNANEDNANTTSETYNTQYQNTLLYNYLNHPKEENSVWLKNPDPTGIDRSSLSKPQFTAYV